MTGPRPELLVASLESLGTEELLRRRAEASRLLDDDGVTYNVRGTIDGRRDRWQLDPVPVVLGSDEWAEIERGAIERAEVLDLVLADLYGPRDLLHKGVVPPAVVLGHPGFLRQADGIRLPGPHQLFTAAFDLARGPDGGHVVLSDRTQAPSGAGYALENRVVTSRVLPSLYRDAEVHRLAPFFRSLRGALQAAAPGGTSDPRIVVLTPGSLSETAFEHAFLAAYLGYPLVEGADLTVRDGRVWLRSLGRLEPVDVILRRVDELWCDPLELQPDSRLGVPGLLEACRLGTVSVVNLPGSGVLENPGLRAYLPRIAERLLGRPLRLPSPVAWWCGDPEGRRVVLDRLPTLAVRALSGPATLGWTLSTEQLDDLRRRIEARPEAWVGEEQATLPPVATLAHRGLEDHPSMLRAFVVARNDSYAALPGGLTRVWHDGPASTTTSKDTWVLASEPETLSGFWLQSGPAVAPEGSMAARAAENLFWLGRYAERAEATTRLLRVVFDRRNDFAHSSNPAGTACLQALLAALTSVTTTYPGFVGAGAAERLADPGDELTRVVSDPDLAGSLAHAVRRLLDAAYAVRDQLSGDTWLVVGVLDRELETWSRQRSVGRDGLGRALHGLLALAGLGAESLVRDQGWRFLDAGRRIERGIQLVELLKATLTVERDTATDSLLLESVLVAGESIITYRRRYRSHAQIPTLLDLLLLDPENPRSLRYQIDQLATDVNALGAAEHPNGKLTEVGRRLVETTAALRLADTEDLATVRPGGWRPGLAAFLDGMATSLAATADALAAEHFVPIVPQRALVLA